MTNIKKKAKCKTCLKFFYFNKNNSKGFYCSHSCYWISMKGKVIKNAKLIQKGQHLSKRTEFKKGHNIGFRNASSFTLCLMCKVVIVDYKSNNRKYCSYKCYHKRKSLLMSKKWSNKKYKERVVKNILKGLIKRPTSLEKQMIGIIKKHKLPYRYVGDGSFLVGYKNPDFVNTNGEKKLIEVGNVFHHQNNYEEKRRNHFVKYGWESHIFIGDSLNEKEVLKVLKNV